MQKTHTSRIYSKQREIKLECVKHHRIVQLYVRRGDLNVLSSRRPS